MCSKKDFQVTSTSESLGIRTKKEIATKGKQRYKRLIKHINEIP
jgi:hypothetical protein